MAGVYSIGTAARLLDVPIATLRTWERRYGCVVPARTGAGQRLYTREQVEQLRFVVERVRDGMRPGAAHRLLSGASRPRALELRLTADACAPAAARRAVDELSDGLGERARYDLRLLVSELVANAVRHAVSASVVLRARVEDGRVRAEVADEGAGFDWSRRPSDEGGRGLALVAAIAERWGLTFDGGTVVWFELPAYVSVTTSSQADPPRSHSSA